MSMVVALSVLSMGQRAIGALAQGGAATSATPAGAAPVPPSAPTSAGEFAAIAVGVGVLGAGLWLMARARRTEADEPCEPPLPLIGAVRRSTMLTLALCIMVTGYHIAAWAVPVWLPLHVPAGRWWLLVGGVGLAIAGSLVAEKLERG